MRALDPQYAPARAGLVSSACAKARCKGAEGTPSTGDDGDYRTLARRVGEAGASEAPAQKTAPAKAEAATQAPAIDTTAYVTVRDLETLERWIAKAREAGIVAFDTETDSLSSANAGNLCGIVAGGAARRVPAYIPVGHEHQDGLQLLITEALDQLALEVVITGAEAAPGRPDPCSRSPRTPNPDMAVLSRHGIEVAPIEDTMLISYVLEAGLHNHGMDELSKLWLGHEPISFKAVARTGKAQKSFKRCSRWSRRPPRMPPKAPTSPSRLCNALRPRLAAEKLTTVYEPPGAAACPQCWPRWNAPGSRSIRAWLRHLGHDFSLRMVGLEAEAPSLAGRPFRLGSPRQIERHGLVPAS